MSKFIKHHSPSSLNLFAASPAMFVLERILGKKQPVGAPAHRGTAVEEGVAHGLVTDDSLDQCAEKALECYDLLMALSSDPRRDHYRKDITGMIEQALGVLRPYGVPSTLQGYVEWRVEGLQLPIVGYFDFEWENRGIIVDLKTTEKLPSEIKIGHARQVAAYCRTDNHDARLCYTTPKKIACYHLDNVAEHRRALVNIAMRVEKFLALSDDPDFFVSITAPDLSSFYWTAPEARALAWEHWGI